LGTSLVAIAQEETALNHIDSVSTHSSLTAHPAQEFIFNLLGNSKGRMAGTNQGNAAEKAIFEELTEAGYTPRYQEHEVSVWQAGKCTLEIVPYRSDNFVMFDAICLQWSSLKADSNGFIYDAGDGSEEELKALSNHNKKGVFLINCPVPDASNLSTWNLETLSRNAISHGATAIIYASRVNEKHISVSVGSASKNLGVPVLSLTGKNGFLLRQWLQEQKLMAFYNFTNSYKKAQARNIVVTIKGKDSSEILISTRLDSRGSSPSVLDNGMGVATVLQMARKMKQDTLQNQRNVTFAFLMGEYDAESGTKTYNQFATFKKIEYFINLSTPAKINSISVPGRITTVLDLQELLHSYNITVNNRVLKQGNQIDYLKAGIPVLIAQSEIADSVLENLCTHADDIHLLNWQDVNHNADLMTKVVSYLAHIDELPDPVLKKRKLRKWLEINGLKE